MATDNNRDMLRQEIRQRYNRRFFLAAHIAVFLMSLILLWLMPALYRLTVMLFVTLIAHALYGIRRVSLLANA
jgi:fatty acid desaturase